MNDDWYVLVHVDGRLLPACKVCGEVAPRDPTAHTAAHGGAR